MSRLTLMMFFSSLELSFLSHRILLVSCFDSMPSAFVMMKGLSIFFLLLNNFCASLPAGILYCICMAYEVYYRVDEVLIKSIKIKWCNILYTILYTIYYIVYYIIYNIPLCILYYIYYIIHLYCILDSIYYIMYSIV